MKVSIDDVQDGKYYVVKLSRYDNEMGTECTINPLMIIGSYGNKKAKAIAGTFKKEEPGKTEKKVCGGKEHIFWKHTTGKALKNLIK